MKDIIKKILKEEFDSENFDWVKDLGNIDLSGWYVTKPSKKLTFSMQGHSGWRLVGNLYYIDFDKDPDKVQAWVSPFGSNYVSQEEDSMYEYIQLAKHEVKHLENKMGSDSETPYGDGPYIWNASEVLEFLEDGYFIKLS